MNSDGLIEQVPQYVLNHHDDGKTEKLSLTVLLPGVASAAELDVRVEPKRVCVRVPGRYKLELPLDVPVDEKPELLRFVKKKNTLKAEFIVLPEASRPAAPPTTRAPSASRGAPEARPHQVHDSFFADLGGSKKQQQAPPAQQQQQAPQQQQQRQASSSAAAGAGAAGGAQASTGAAAAPPDKAQAAEQAAAGHSAPKAAHQPHAGTAPPEHQPAASGGSSSGADVLYESAKQQANREAAQEAYQRAQPLIQAREYARALKLLSKAASLWPGKYEDELSAVQRMQQQQQQEQQQQQGSSAAAGERQQPSAAQNGDHTTASQARPQQQQQQAAKADSSSARHAGQQDGSGGRPSQPYSYKPPGSTETNSSTDMPSANGAGGQQGSAGPYTSNAGTKGAPGASGPTRQQQGPNSKAGAAKTAGGGAGRGGTGPGAAGQGSERAGRPSGTAGRGTRPSRSPPPASAPPPAPEPDPAADSLDEEGSSSDPWLLKKLDHMFSIAYEAVSRRSSWAAYVLWLLYVALSITITLGIAGVILLSNLAPMAVELMYSARSARRLRANMSKSVMFRLLCALPGAVLLYFVVRLLLWMLLDPVTFMLRMALTAVSWLLWQPSLFLCLPLSGSLFLAETHLGAWRKVAVVPVMLYLAGTRWWVLICLALFLALLLLSGGAQIVSACTAVFVVKVVRSYVWYKSVPGVLLAVVIWVAIVAKSASDDSGSGKGGSKSQSSRSRSSAGAEGDGGARGSSWWGSSSGASAKLKSEVPKGASGEVARVLRSKDLYEVLEVGRDADEDAIRRAKRTKSLATHPDKVGNAPGAKEAFQRVTEAFDVLGNTTSRAQYDAKLRQEEAGRRAPPPPQGYSEAAEAGAGPEFSDGAHAGLILPCRGCGGEHEAHITNINPATARYCSRCESYHAAKNGEAWISHHGFLASKKVYVCVSQVVFDITDYARCTGMMHDSHGRPIEANSCRAPFKFATDPGTARGGRPPGGAGMAGSTKGSKSKKTGKKR